MGVQERRARHKEALRQQILDAARDVFVREGYENVSMRKIAEKIEYSPTTIYLYFQDKQELLTCLTEETFARLGKVIRAIMEEDIPPLEQLRRGLRAYVEFGLSNPNDYKVVLLLSREPLENSMAEETMSRKVYNCLREILAECIATNSIRPLDLDMAAQTLWPAVHGITSLLIQHPDFPWVERDPLIDSVIDTIIAGLRV